MCFRNNGLPIQEKNGASSTFVSRSACCGSPWRPVHSAGTLPMYSSGSGSIPAWKNPPPGIIFPGRMHPCQKKSPARDYFSKVEASLPGEPHRWGLFSRGESISARRNAPLGIISPRRKHLCSKNSTVWDYFSELNASLPGEIPLQGLLFQCGIIPVRRNPPLGIIFPERMHPHVADRQQQDDLVAGNASPRHNFSI